MPEAGFEVTLLPGRGIQRRLTRENLGAVAGLVAACAMGLSIVLWRRPRVVVTVGGYAGFPCARGDTCACAARRSELRRSRGRLQPSRGALCQQVRSRLPGHVAPEPGRDRGTAQTGGARCRPLPAGAPCGPHRLGAGGRAFPPCRRGRLAGRPPPQRRGARAGEIVGFARRRHDLPRGRRAEPRPDRAGGRPPRPRPEDLAGGRSRLPPRRLRAEDAPCARGLATSPSAGQGRRPWPSWRRSGRRARARPAARGAERPPDTQRGGVVLDRGGRSRPRRRLLGRAAGRDRLVLIDDRSASGPTSLAAAATGHKDAADRVAALAESVAKVGA